MTDQNPIPASLIDELASRAFSHAEALSGDVSLCGNREEHIRVTARANEAHALAVALADLSNRLSGS